DLPPILLDRKPVPSLAVPGEYKLRIRVGVLADARQDFHRRRGQWNDVIRLLLGRRCRLRPDAGVDIYLIPLRRKPLASARAGQEQQSEYVGHLLVLVLGERLEQSRQLVG